jgi:hypothetical protein
MCKLGFKLKRRAKIALPRVFHSRLFSNNYSCVVRAFVPKKPSFVRMRAGFVGLAIFHFERRLPRAFHSSWEGQFQKVNGSVTVWSVSSGTTSLRQ